MRDKSGSGLPIFRLFRRRPHASAPPAPPDPPPAPAEMAPAEMAAADMSAAEMAAADMAAAEMAAAPGWPEWLTAFPAWAAVADPERQDAPPLLLIEAADFFFRDDSLALEARLAAASRPARVRFVPPRFLPRHADGTLDAAAGHARWRDRLPAPPPPVAAEIGLSIVCLGDARITQRLATALTGPLEAEFGVKVHFTTATLPPPSVVLSDLVFADWFAPDPGGAMAPVTAALAPLRGASLILADLSQTWRGAARAVYPVLSHDGARDPAAERLVLRDQPYTRAHADLPVGLVSCLAMSPSGQAGVLRHLGRYLEVPCFGILPDSGLTPLDEVADFVMAPGPGGASVLAGAVLSRLRDHPPRAVPLPVTAASGPTGPARFGAVLAAEAMLAPLAEAFAGFALVGPDASLPWLRHRLAALGRPCVAVARFDAPELAAVPPDTCLVACGAMGVAPGSGPMVAFMPIGQGGLSRALGREAAKLGAPATWFDQPQAAPAWYTPEPPAAWTEAERAALAEATPVFGRRA